METNNTESEDHGHGHKLKLTIVTPVGKWEAQFEPATTVADVIAKTIEHFHSKLNASDPYELRKKDSEVALDAGQTLEALGIHDGDILMLVKSTVGGGK